MKLQGFKPIKIRVGDKKDGMEWLVKMPDCGKVKGQFYNMFFFKYIYSFNVGNSLPVII